MGCCTVYGLELVSTTSSLVFLFGICGGVIRGNVSISVYVTLVASATLLFSVGLFYFSVEILVGGYPTIGSSVVLVVMDDNWGCVEGNF